MGFVRQQEEKLAIRYLSWQYQREKRSLPPNKELKRQAIKIVDDAHRIARTRGRNVVSIIKELIEDIKKK